MAVDVTRTQEPSGVLVLALARDLLCERLQFGECEPDQKACRGLLSP